MEDGDRLGPRAVRCGIASAATLLGPALTTDFDFTNSPEAKRAQQILQERRLTQDTITETFVVTGEPGAVEDPTFVERVNTFLTDLNGLGPTSSQRSRRRSR